MLENVATMQVVRVSNKGDPAKVRRIAMDRNLRMAAQQELEDDMYALTTTPPERLVWLPGRSFILGGLARMSPCFL